MPSAFKDPMKIWNCIYQMLVADLPRSQNRTRINRVFNGDAPYTDAEAQDNRIDTNVNFLEGTRIMQQARGQWNNAFQKPNRFFTVTLPDAKPVWERQKWGEVITGKINRTMKKDRKYRETLKSQGAGACLHGIAPVVWLRGRDWRPFARGVEDVLVPSATLNTLENLDHFAIRTTFTPAELMRTVWPERGKPDPAWNIPAIKKILERLKGLEVNAVSSQSWGYYWSPEKIEEDFKENSGFFGTDAVPVIRCFDFYFLDGKDDENPTWRRRIVLDQYNESINGEVPLTDFIFDSGNRSYGEDIAQMMHVQFADGCVVPPFRWHAVRSLGYLLYAVCHLMNRYRCRSTDSAFEALLWYFHNVAEGDKERLQQVQLMHMGVIPQGLSWVPQNERHQVNWEMVNGTFGQFRQLMQEHSASYTQTGEQGVSGPEKTATQVMAEVNSASALLGTMLTNAYDYQEEQYREICRRFCTLDDPDCIAFREHCIAEGVPRSVLDVERWEISVEKIMGAGNKTLQVAQTQQLLTIRPQLDPPAQRMIDRMAVQTYTDDPDLADLMVPLQPAGPSRTVELASLAWGTLMTGGAPVLANGINRIELIDTLMKLLIADIQTINQSGGMVEDKTVLRGLGNVVEYLQMQVKLVAVDQQQEQRVKQYEDALGQAMNYLKAYAQRLQQQEQAKAQAGGQGGPDPKALADAQIDMQLADLKARNLDKSAEQKRMHKEIAFQAQQHRDDAKTAADIADQDVRSRADLLLKARESALTPQKPEAVEA